MSNDGQGYPLTPGVYIPDQIAAGRRSPTRYTPRWAGEKLSSKRYRIPGISLYRNTLVLLSRSVSTVLILFFMVRMVLAFLDRGFVWKPGMSYRSGRKFKDRFCINTSM